MKTNFHTHHELCGHAIGTAKDYVEYAIKSGYDRIGLTDHGPIPRDAMSQDDYFGNYLHLQMNESDFETIYLPDCLQAKQKFQHQIDVLIGLEIEYIPTHKSYLQSLADRLDYLILGVHYFPFQGHMHNVYEWMNSESVQTYGDHVQEALDSGLYRILAHPDIFLMKYHHNKEAIFDTAAIETTHKIIQAAIKNDVYLEINCGGAKREGLHYQHQTRYVYPREEFWRIVATYPEAKVIIGVDAHAPAHLGNPVIEEMKHFATRCGVTWMDNPMIQGRIRFQGNEI